jgi:hypothetical protein
MLGMDVGVVLGGLILLALLLAIGGGFAAARFLSHAADEWTRGAADTRDR